MPEFEDFLYTIPNYLSAIAGLGIVIFTVLYASYANWTETAPGRAVMYLSSSLSLLLLLVTTHLFIKDYYWGRNELRILVYGYLAYAGLQLPWTLIQVLRKHSPMVFSVIQIIPPRWRKYVPNRWIARARLVRIKKKENHG